MAKHALLVFNDAFELRLMFRLVPFVGLSLSFLLGYFDLTELGVKPYFQSSIRLVFGMSWLSTTLRSAMVAAAPNLT